MSTAQAQTRGPREIRQLGERDHDALAALALSSSTGSAHFRVDRSKDYFALGHALGDTRFYGLFEESKLIGSLAVSEQLRFVARKAERVAYIHDVRVSPHRAGRGAFSEFVKELARRHAEEFRWVFCTVLDENPHAPAIRKVGARFGAERVLGHCVHVGLPAVSVRVSGLDVGHIPASEAWCHYVRLAAGLDMAPADEARFMADSAECLAVLKGGQVIAVAKWLDQSRVRRIISARDRSLPETLLSAWLVAQGGAALAKRDEALPIAYLAHFATSSADPSIARALAAFTARTSPHRHSHVFLGVAPGAARAYRGLGVVHLTSTTFGYGSVPPRLQLAFRELSWI